MSRKEARRPGLVQLAVAEKITTARGGPELGDDPAAVSAPQGPVSGRGDAGAWSTGAGASRRAEAWTWRSGGGSSSWCRPHTATSMTATAPRSSGTSRACPSAGARSGGSGGPGACPPNAGAGRLSTAPAARAARPWAPSCSWTAASSTGSAPERRSLLLGAIDDATSTVLALHFRPAEDLHGYLTLLGRLAARAGLPVTLYGDRLGVFVRNDDHWSLEEELQGAQHPTHFGHVLRDLGIGYIAAHSPEAKGRIERLWDTLQDRLVAELRLHGIHHCRGRRGLPAHLPRGPQPPLGPAARGDHPGLAAPAPRSRRAPQLPLHAPRRPRQHRPPRRPRWVQIPRGPHGRSYAGCRVEVRECLDGRLLVDYQGRRLATAPAPAPEFTLVPRRPTPPCPQEPFRGGGPRSPPSPKSRIFGPRGARGLGPAPPPPGAPPPLAADLFPPATRTPSSARPSPPDGRTFSLNS